MGKVGGGEVLQSSHHTFLATLEPEPHTLSNAYTKQGVVSRLW